MSKARGFTLTEMLVVLAIIGALAGIGYPVTRSFIGNSREAACLGKLRASKTEDLPVLETVLLPYLDAPAAFQCPADKEQFVKSGSSYLWNSTQNGLHVSQLSFFGIKDRPDKIPLITDKESWHPGGTNFLYADSSSSNKPRFAAGN
jgi:prepilin-type N-terminal cleavage/methylation domain-containing protein/prepilin-type processing-associated H-X9-DG protein